MSAVDRLLKRAPSTVKHTVVAPKQEGPQQPRRVFNVSTIKVAQPQPVLGNVKIQTKKIDVMAHLEAKRREGLASVGKNGFSEDELKKIKVEYEEYVKNLMANMGDEPMLFKPEPDKPEATAETSEPAAVEPPKDTEPLVQGISVGDEAPVDTIVVTKKSRKKKTIFD